MHEDPHVSDPLVHDLRRLERNPAWPDDDPVLAAARATLRGRPARRPLRLVGWSAGLAAAAGLAISTIAWLNPPVRRAPAPELASADESPGDAPALPAGPAFPVTMLDAYRLTLILDRRETAAPAWDANADGAIDGLDVDALAARAVSLAENAS